MAIPPLPPATNPIVTQDRPPTIEFALWLAAIDAAVRSISGSGGGGGPLFTPSIQTPAPVGNPGGNVETTLISFTLPANSVTAIGKGVRVRAAGYWGTGGNLATIRLYFGSEFITLTNGATEGSRWQAEMEAIITATGPTKEYVSGRASYLTVDPPFGSNPSIDMTSSVVCKVTGQGGVANQAFAYQLIVEPLLSDVAALL